MFSPVDERAPGLEADPELADVFFPFRDLTGEELAREARSLALARAELDSREADLLVEVHRRRSQGWSMPRDAGAWLRQTTGIARSTARMRAEVARELAQLVEVHTALAAGWIGFDHARVFAEHANSPNRDELHADETRLVLRARRLDAEGFRAEMAGWARDLDERRHAGETKAEREHRRRKLTRGRTRDGLRRMTLEYGDHDAALLEGTLGSIVGEMRRAERGLDPDRKRRPGQLWFDAMVEMAHRSAGADVVTKHKARPVVLALTEMSVLWDQLRINGWCELEDGTKLTAAQIRRLACEADIIPMVLDADGVVLDMGRGIRYAGYHQRMALRAMHATCAVEGCDIPFDWCEIHHLHPWEDGGRTDLANLVPLCAQHHHELHDWGLDAEVLRDRTVRMYRGVLNPTRRQRQRHHSLRQMGRPPDLVPARP